MPGLSLIPPLLLAQSRIEAMPMVVHSVAVAEVADDSPSVGLTTVVLLTIAVALAAGAVVRYALHHSNANWQMFRELCRAHELSRGQCRALRRLSRQLRMANPNRLFLEADLWSQTHTDALPANAKQTAASAAQQELHKLLFSHAPRQPFMG